MLILHITYNKGVSTMASEAQRRANDKWRGKNLMKYVFVCLKAQKAWIQNHAIAQGESVNAFVNRAIQEAMERDNAAK